MVIDGKSTQMGNSFWVVTDKPVFFFFKLTNSFVLFSLLLNFFSAHPTMTRYICRNSETPGQVSWDQDIDCAMLVYINQNIAGLGRSSKLLSNTPLMLGVGKSEFLSDKEAKRLLKTTPVSNRPKKKQKKSNSSQDKIAKKRELKRLIEDYQIVYGKPPAKYLTTSIDALKEKMPHGTTLFQVAGCPSDYVGKWTGDWESCYVVATNAVDKVYNIVVAEDHDHCRNIPFKFVRNMP